MPPVVHNPVVLSIGGSDSSSGAGIQADLKTATSLGAWCHTVVTAITAQNPIAVSAVHPVDLESLNAQLDAIMALKEQAEAFAPTVVKVGMLTSVAQVLRLQNFQKMYTLPLVLDPVMRASSGADLGGKGLPQALLEYLPEYTCLLTPNLPEAACLLGSKEAQSVADMREQAKALQNKGFKAVLLKGGHLPGSKLVDVLLWGESETLFEDEKIPSPHTHGSGCTLATATAVGLAKGKTMASAVQDARQFVRQAIHNASESSFVSKPFLSDAKRQHLKTNGPLLHFKPHAEN